MKSFTGDLQGKYYSLAKLTEEEDKQLTEDNFLFKIGDRFQEACGINRDFPEARGVFHNKSKNLLVWVNDEDQLKVISMEEGCDFHAVFTRLSKACGKIQEHAEFAHSPHLGYITTRPSTLGTGLRVSILIRLPRLEEHRKEFRAITERYSISFRAVIVSSGQPHDNLYELSNRKRLGASEVELVQDMYDAVKELIALERNLSRPPDTPCGRHL